MKFYTYAHFRKSDGLPFYVGKGMARRAFAFNCRGAHWRATCKKHGVKVEIMAQWETEFEAFEHEKFLISCFKDLGHNLCNKTDGGEGVSGLKWSEASRAKVVGHKRNSSAEARALISERTRVAMNCDEIRRKVGHSAGKNLSEETRKKMSDAHKRLLTPERIELLQKQGRDGVTDESRAKISKAILGLKRDKIICLHCGKDGAKNVMVRWHFDHCKHKNGVYTR
jgi:hypothetical protein